MIPHIYNPTFFKDFDYVEDFNVFVPEELGF
jgi:hypothetical protein